MQASDGYVCVGIFIAAAYDSLAPHHSLWIFGLGYIFGMVLFARILRT